MTWLWVMLGSALGGVARLSGLAAHHIGETFPIGTLIVNVTGCGDQLVDGCAMIPSKQFDHAREHA